MGGFVSWFASRNSWDEKRKQRWYFIYGCLEILFIIGIGIIIAFSDSHCLCSEPSKNTLQFNDCYSKCMVGFNDTINDFICKADCFRNTTGISYLISPNNLAIPNNINANG